MLFKFLKRILRYIKGTIDFSLVYNANNENMVTGYCDADWAGDTGDRKSTSGYIFDIFNCPVSWCSKKQSCVSLSSTEAEYYVLSVTIVEGCWLRNLLSDIGYKMMVQIYEDNQSVIRIAEDNNSNKRLKHIDIRYHFIIEKVTNGLIELKYINSKCNTADLFTKPLGNF